MLSVAAAARTLNDQQQVIDESIWLGGHKLAH